MGVLQGTWEIQPPPRKRYRKPKETEESGKGDWKSEQLV